MKRTYKAFTLVEMLIVMGILAILMTIGISVGRFAIQRANNIQHQSAADQIGQAIQSHYTDQRRYPADIGTDPSKGVLDEYIDASFDAGSEATLYYDVSATHQAYLVCITFGGQNDLDELGVYCTGDGFEESDVFGGGISEESLEFGSDMYNQFMNNEISSAASTAQWDGSSWGGSASE